MGDYTLGKCTNFGTKDIITNTITYDYVDICRYDADKCGKEGKYYEMEKYFDTKYTEFIYNFYYSYSILYSS
jgi:hypothetical protein